MRKKIVSANWKMNLKLNQANELIDAILKNIKPLSESQEVIIAPPFIYNTILKEKINDKKNIFIAAQNCYNKTSGAFTGEISAEMLHSIGVDYVILGHSERREYFAESNTMLKEKIELALDNNLKVIFCCGESLTTREQNEHTQFIQKQIADSLFSLSESKIKNIVIAYEPIWAIGTGKTASTEQAQEVHAMIRKFIKTKYTCADDISILYGGSVKASNAKELFSCPDIDGALVGGASLVADEFLQIINAI